MKKILVTGGAGFIGAHLVQKLIDKRFKVMVVDSLKTIGDILDDRVLKKIIMLVLLI